MMEYTTQMDAARKGIITPQMEIVAKKEKMEVEKLRGLVAEMSCGCDIADVLLQEKSDLTKFIHQKMCFGCKVAQKHIFLFGQSLFLP